MARRKHRSGGSRFSYYSGFAPYVPVAERRAKAAREMQKLKEKGQDVQPVELSGKKIATSFWGKGWCDHLETFSDFANRLPRGRTYVRNGSVCHLAIKPGVIEAMVSGSSLYKITIKVKPLDPKIWKSVKEKCSGHIGSMLELLQGKLSDQVMAVVSDREHGLFPQPGEISLSCSCPDWAGMCKHVAAALYGVGSRLDTHPELLFVLRGVPAGELISAQMALPEVVGGDVLGGENLGAIFGIELEGEQNTAEPQPKAAKPKAAKPKAAKPKAAKAKGRARTKRSTVVSKEAPPPKPAKQKAKTTRTRKPVKQKAKSTGPRKPKPVFDPKAPTGKSIAALRKKSGRSVPEFARDLKVSEASVQRWEGTPGPLRLQARPLEALSKLQKKILRK